MRAHRYSDDPLATWGCYSVPAISADQLRLDDELPHVPPNGHVVDVGAGAALTIAASIFSLRPDLRITAVDPGYALIDEDTEEFEAAVDTTIECFDDDKQATLRGSKAWRDTLLPGIGEAQPLPDESADLVVSYAAVPYYSRDKEAVLGETLRVLRLGGLAIHGPMEEDDFAEWDAAIRQALTAGQITDYSSRAETVTTPYGYLEDAYFTRFVK